MNVTFTAPFETVTHPITPVDRKYLDNLNFTLKICNSSLNVIIVSHPISLAASLSYAPVEFDVTMFIIHLWIFLVSLVGKYSADETCQRFHNKPMNWNTEIRCILNVKNEATALIYNLR